MDNSKKRVVIYCRESRDDYFLNINRIETQRDILREFCKHSGYLNIVLEVMDDDVSGTSFKRFEKIIQLAKDKKIDTIVFKDSSRLGRNLKESIQFIDFMEEYGVEIVFESEDYNEDFFPLQAWFNEQRAKEDSRKIRRVFKHKMETGQLLIKPTYGYIKDGKNLIIEPESEKVIKLIYEMFLKGESINNIVYFLNKNKYETPSQRNNHHRKASLWNYQHIRRILKNEIYTGTMVYKKSTKLSFKSKKIVRNKEEDHIKIENHHDKIISKEDFDTVNKLLRIKYS